MNKGRQYKTVKEFYQHQIAPQSTLLNEKKDSLPTLNMKWENVNNGSLVDPTIWGPSFWFSIHNGALRYPQNASKIVGEKMKNFIIGLPYILPCADCAEHAKAYIDSRWDSLDMICSGRNNLFCFFVEFHNYVNRRYNKPEMSCEHAKELYSGRVNVMKMTYK